MSKLYGLNQRYTNHCVRVTSVQLLTTRSLKEDILLELLGTKVKPLLNAMLANFHLLEKKAFQKHLLKLTVLSTASSSKKFKENDQGNQQIVPISSDLRCYNSPLFKRPQDRMYLWFIWMMTT